MKNKKPTVKFAGTEYYSHAKNTQPIFFLSLIVFVLLLFVIPTSLVSSDLGNIVLTITSFLFGIISGFYIVVTTTDYNNLKSILASETANWIFLYKNILAYDKHLAKEFSLLVDAYIRRNFDYELIDYSRGTSVEFEAISDKIKKIPVKDDLSSSINQIFGSILFSRQQLLVLGSKSLSVFQWLVLVVLAGLLVFSLYGLRSGELFFNVVTVAVSSLSVLLLLLIRDLDRYTWNEKTFSFDVFQSVFKAIGQLPYYPAESLKEGRIIPRDNEYRIGKFIDFPNSLARKIKVIKKR
jgi:hypothetical protein